MQVTCICVLVSADVRLDWTLPRESSRVELASLMNESFSLRANFKVVKRPPNVMLDFRFRADWPSSCAFTTPTRPHNSTRAASLRVEPTKRRTGSAATKSSWLGLDSAPEIKTHPWVFWRSFGRSVGRSVGPLISSFD